EARLVAFCQQSLTTAPRSEEAARDHEGIGTAHVSVLEYFDTQKHLNGSALCPPVRRARAAPPASAGPSRTRAASAPRGCALGPAVSPDEGDRKRASDTAELAFQVVQHQQE